MPFLFWLFIQSFLIVLKVTETVAWSWWVIWTPLYVGLAWFVFIAIHVSFLVNKIDKQKRAFR